MSTFSTEAGNTHVPVFLNNYNWGKRIRNTSNKEITLSRRVRFNTPYNSRPPVASYVILEVSWLNGSQENPCNLDKV
jgi:hypothetical protein